MLLASRTLANKAEDGDSIYDPFNPTQSDSSSSEDEAESRRLGSSSHTTACDRRAASLGNNAVSAQADIKEETQELVMSGEESSRTSPQDALTKKVRCWKVKKFSRVVQSETEKQTLCDHKVKEETEEKLTTNDVNPSTFFKNDSSASTTKTGKAKMLNESSSNSLSRDFSQKVFHSCSSVTDQGGRSDHYSPDHTIKEKEKNKNRENSPGHSKAWKRRSAHSSSESSLSNSPNRTHRRQSRSPRSKDRRPSR